MIVIAIDGPSGTGKSTVARTLAERLDLPYLDTGAMYRAVGFVARDRNVALDAAEELGEIAGEFRFRMLDDRSSGRLQAGIEVEGVDRSTDIRTPEASQAASTVAVHPQVREHLVRRQREWVETSGGGVVEGRDIGTVVFPQATLKVFLTADDEERVRRRQRDAHAPGFSDLTDSEIARELRERDTRDSTRDSSPLAVPDDSVVVDTSGRSIDEVVTTVIEALKVRLGGQLPAGTSAE